MALNAYLSLTGQRQGPIRGSVTQKGREGKIMVIGVMHEIVCPRDPSSGLPTGKRVHKPLTVLKEVDRSSPLLYAVLTSNESISAARLDFWTPTAAGTERQHYTVRLTGANISGIFLKMANVRSPKLSRLPEYEEVSFTYQKIEWTWNEGGLSAADDWETPR
jgi:type VI secretion system secreted protein Hcp